MATTKVNTPVPGIARAAMLAHLVITTYTGRKQDKATQNEVTSSKGAASKRAASVYKSLFAECPELDAIVRYQSAVRTRHYRLTLPWTDMGPRLLPTRLLFTYQQEMDTHRQEFDRLVGLFLDRYDTLVAAAAFQLGSLFDRAEYPTRDEVAERFSFYITYVPLPTSGDFRLDIENEVQSELMQQYERKLQASIQEANQDAWTRLHTTLTNISERLKVSDDGKKAVFRDSLVDNAQDLCDLLTQLNVTNDHDLERARRKLEEALVGVTPQALRDELDTRVETKRKVDDLLGMFDFGVE